MAKKKTVTVTPVEDESLINRLLVAFEQARKIDSLGREYWEAREYSKILGYQWRNFEAVIDRAKAACSDEGDIVDDHFAHVRKMMPLGKGAEREGDDYELTRRACYLIGINGDPRKKESIAAVQTYFVEQARKQEISEMLRLAGTDAERLAVRHKLSQTEKEFGDIARPRLTVPDLHTRQIREAGHEELMQMSTTEIREHFDTPDDRDVMDFADPLIGKATDFATAVATRRLQNDPELKGLRKIKEVNKETHRGARNVLVDANAHPKTLPRAEDIRIVQARVEKQRAKLERKNSESSDGSEES